MTSRVTDDRVPVIGNIVRGVASDLTIALGTTISTIRDEN